jgi:hypothetical protein
MPIPKTPKGVGMLGPRAKLKKLKWDGPGGNLDKKEVEPEKKTTPTVKELSVTQDREDAKKINVTADIELPVTPERPKEPAVDVYPPDEPVKKRRRRKLKRNS